MVLDVTVFKLGEGTQNQYTNVIINKCRKHKNVLIC